MRRPWFACLLALTPMPAAGVAAPTTPAPASTSAGMVTATTPVPATRWTTRVHRAPARTAAPPFTLRVSAARGPVRDSAGHVWQPRSLALGTWTFADRMGANRVLGTRDQALYRTTAPKIAWFRQQVPAGAYRVRLHFVEDYWQAPGRRVFSVTAQGRPLVDHLDLARTVGRYRAHVVTATVSAPRGRLDLDFTAHVGNPILSAVEIVGLTPNTAPASITTASVGGAAAADSAARSGALSPRGRLVNLAPTSPFYQDVSAAPPAANSARLAAALTRQVRDRWGGTAALNAFSYNTAMNRARPGQPRVRVGFHDCQKKGDRPGGLFDGPGHFLNVPVPADAHATRGTDAAMTIYDPAADQVWEFWQMRQNPRDGRWSACWGGRIDRVSRSLGVFAAPYGASASGLLTAAGTISLDEARRGTIDHALSLGIPETAYFTRFSWPANRSDGGTRDADALAIGQRLRLDPTLDLTRFDLTPLGLMVARAAQTYGFIVTESSGAVAISTESGAVERARTGRDPWSEMLAGPAYQALTNFPWEHVQALPLDYGKPRR